MLNIEQVNRLPEQYYLEPKPKLNPVQRIEHAEAFLAAAKGRNPQRGGRAYYAQEPDYIQMPRSRASPMLKAFTPPSRTKLFTGPRC